VEQAVAVGNAAFSSSGRPCGSASTDFAECPYTARLKQRLLENPVPYGNPLCRCQNAYSTVRVTATPAGTGFTEHVILNYGPGNTEHLDLIIVKSNTKWLIADITCTGKGDSTSLFAANPGLCE
jgi:hypothetical protein